MPIYCLSSSIQASAVVPEPIKGSKTIPLGGVIRRIKYLIRDRGFTIHVG